jgi:hypothetical protein
MSHYATVLRHRVSHALAHLLTTERHNWARELATILREIADDLDPPQSPTGPTGGPPEGGFTPTS